MSNTLTRRKGEYICKKRRGACAHNKKMAIHKLRRNQSSWHLNLDLWAQVSGKAEFLFGSQSMVFCYGNTIWYNKPLIILNFPQHCFPESLKYKSTRITQHIGLKKLFPSLWAQTTAFSVKRHTFSRCCYCTNNNVPILWQSNPG